MFRVDDRVRVRWLVQSDCLGLTGTVLDVQPSVFLGRDVQWCWGDLAVGIVRTTIFRNILRILRVVIAVMMMAPFHLLKVLHQFVKC